jgi:hypothetical protein
MADDDGKQGDLKYFQNQPYDMEVDLNNDDEDGDNVNTKKKQSKNDNEDEQQEEQNYQEIAAPIQVKELPKFDISKFEDLPTSAEAKELLSIMKK